MMRKLVNSAALSLALLLPTVSAGPVLAEAAAEPPLLTEQVATGALPPTARRT